MSNGSINSKLEEFKEAGVEYRYRDKLMVQEFSLAMVAVGLFLNLLREIALSLWYVGLQALGWLFLFLLAFHLHHINQDRRAALDRREALRQDLCFAAIHQGTGGKRVSAPRLMVWFTTLVCVVWAIWIVVSAFQLIKGSS